MGKPWPERSLRPSRRFSLHSDRRIGSFKPQLQHHFNIANSTRIRVLTRRKRCRLSRDHDEIYARIRVLTRRKRCRLSRDHDEMYAIPMHGRQRTTDLVRYIKSGLTFLSKPVLRMLKFKMRSCNFKFNFKSPVYASR